MRARINLLLLILLLASPAGAEYETEVVLRSDRPAPGLDGAVLDTFDPAFYALSDDGKVVFSAGGLGAPAICLLTASGVEVIARPGDVPPGHPNAQFLPNAGRIRPNLSDDGRFELAADLLTEFWGSDPQLAIFRRGAGVDDPLVVHHVAGSQLGSESDPYRYMRTLGFTGPANVVEVLYSQDRGSTGLALETSWEPGAPGYTTIMRPGEYFERYGSNLLAASALAIAPDGRTVVVGNFYNQGGFTALMVRDADGTIHHIADDQAGGLLQPQTVQIATDGSIVMFGSAPSAQARGLFRIHPESSTMSSLVLLGETAPDYGNHFFLNIGSWAAAPGEEVYFVSETSDNYSTLWRTTPTSLELVARPGDSIRDRQSRRFATTGFTNFLFGAVWAATDGTIYFTARVDGAGAPENASGLFAYRNGIIRTVVMSGDAIDDKIVDTISVTNSPYGEYVSGRTIGDGSSASGRQSPVNGNGEIAFHVTATDGTRLMLIGGPSIVVNSTGDRADADPSDGVCSVEPLDAVPDGQDPECTLRAAIEQANYDSGSDRIRFAIANEGAGPWTIAPTSPLPSITSAVDIEGPTDNSGPLAPRPLVIIEGSRTTGIGLHLATLAARADGEVRSSIRRLGLDLWDTGLLVEQDGATLKNNWIGVDPWAESLSAVDVALHVRNADRVVVERNRVDGSAAGIYLEDSTNGLLESNRIGDIADDRIDTNVESLGSTGIVAAGGGFHRIGGTSFSSGNVIAGTKLGIHLASNSNHNDVLGNRIGTDYEGRTVVANREAGIKITASARNEIGIATPEPGTWGGNLIVGSPWGIRIRGLSARHNLVRGNLLGALIDGTIDTSNGEVGIEVSQGAYRTRIGGGFDANSWSGNLIQDYLVTDLKHGGGIVLRDDVLTTVAGNTIDECTYGVDLDGSEKPVLSVNVIFDAFIAIRAQARPIVDPRIGVNILDSSHVAGSGIVMNAGDGRIYGNLFNVQSTGISLAPEATAFLRSNCFAGVGDVGVQATGTRVAPIDARENWWGAADGPSGEGGGSGSAVSSQVDFDPWLDAKDGRLVTALDTTTVMIDEETGQAELEALWFAFGYFAPDTPDTMRVLAEITDEAGWIGSGSGRRTMVASTSLEVTVGPDGLAMVEVPLEVPAGTAAGTSNRVELHLDGELVATSTVVLGQPVLDAIELTAPKTRVAVNRQIDLVAIGRDPQGNAVSFAPVWSSSAGTVSADGRFTAPGQVGAVTVTVSNGDGTIESSLVIDVTATVRVEDPVDDTPARLPREIALAQNRPNPFNPSTEIGFALPRGERVRLAVFNVRGERVRTLVAGEHLDAGSYQRTWNGTDENNRGVASGVYFYRLETPSRVLTKRMLLVK